MSKPRRLGYILGLIGLLQACGSIPQAPQAGSNKPAIFFDLEAWTDELAAELKGRQVRKTLVYQGQEEVLELSPSDWQNELVFFRQADINKAIWAERYRCDTLGRQPLHWRYTALDEGLSTRVLELYQSENSPRPDSLRLQTLVKNGLYTQTRDLVYSPQSLSLYQEEAVLGRDTRTYKVIWDLLP